MNKKKVMIGLASLQEDFSSFPEKRLEEEWF